MTRTVRFELQTLPGSGIWTGGSDQKMTTMTGSSLLGGMRFWTEAFLRSFGHEVCDCIASKEIYKPKTKQSEGKEVCAGCHVFGCTGLARAFMLHVEQSKAPVAFSPEKTVVKFHPRGDGERFYAIPSGWRGALSLAFSCRRPLSWPLSRLKLSLIHI